MGMGDGARSQKNLPFKKLNFRRILKWRITTEPTWSGEMAQRIEALATGLHDLSSLPTTHIGRKEAVPQIVL